MKIWGEQNFDNEGAKAYIEMLAAKLMATVREIVNDPERLELDEGGAAIVMPSIELLALWGGRSGAPPPRRETVRRWTETYLKQYAATIDQVCPDETFKANRRKVIERTFHWLEGLAQTHHQK